MYLLVWVKHPTPRAAADQIVRGVQLVRLLRASPNNGLYDWLYFGGIGCTIGCTAGDARTRRKAPPRPWVSRSRRGFSARWGRCPSPLDEGFLRLRDTIPRFRPRTHSTMNGTACPAARRSSLRQRPSVVRQMRARYRPKASDLAVWTVSGHSMPSTHDSQSTTNRRAASPALRVSPLRSGCSAPEAEAALRGSCGSRRQGPRRACRHRPPSAAERGRPRCQVRSSDLRIDVDTRNERRGQLCPG